MLMYNLITCQNYNLYYSILLFMQMPNNKSPNHAQPKFHNSIKLNFKPIDIKPKHIEPSDIKSFIYQLENNQNHLDQHTITSIVSLLTQYREGLEEKSRKHILSCKTNQNKTMEEENCNKELNKQKNIFKTRTLYKKNKIPKLNLAKSAIFRENFQEVETPLSTLKVDPEVKQLQAIRNQNHTLKSQNMRLREYVHLKDAQLKEYISKYETLTKYCSNQDQNFAYMVTLYEQKYQEIHCQHSNIL